MCEKCENQFGHMAQTFDATLADYRHDQQVGKMADTPGQRCCNNADMFIELCQKMEGGTYLLGWYLAIAMERLTSLEMAGVPT